MSHIEDVQGLCQNPRSLPSALTTELLRHGQDNKKYIFFDILSTLPMDNLKLLPAWAIAGFVLVLKMTLSTFWWIKYHTMTCNIR